MFFLTDKFRSVKNHIQPEKAGLCRRHPNHIQRDIIFDGRKSIFGRKFRLAGIVQVYACHRMCFLMFIDPHVTSILYTGYKVEGFMGNQRFLELLECLGI